MNPDDSIYVAGSSGLVGQALVRALTKKGFKKLSLVPRALLDLCDLRETLSYFETMQPDYVFLAAARVGGIQANSDYCADFIRENLLIQTHVIEACARTQVQKLLFLGSSCIYPKHAPQPMAEDMLMTGPLEPTNSAYAMAKLAGLELCRTYYEQYGLKSVCLLPSNLYGPNDNFNEETAHALPALLKKFHDAKQTGEAVKVWGTGAAVREFLYVDDLAEACLLAMEKVETPYPINVGAGVSYTISELVIEIIRATGFQGSVYFDHEKPDGTPAKRLDTRAMEALGWRATTELRDGLEKTYEWFLKRGL